MPNIPSCLHFIGNTEISHMIFLIFYANIFLSVTAKTFRGTPGYTAVFVFPKIRYRYYPLFILVYLLIFT
mgnify:CR=1 FL=1